jgi:hypothetical protein
VLLYRSVRQRLIPDQRLLSLMNWFLLMMNDCIRLGLESDDVSYQAVKALCYPRMTEYGIENSYRVAAMFETSNLLKKYRTDLKSRHASRPICRNPFVSVSLGVGTEGDQLVMPGNRRLNLNSHTLSVLRQADIEIVSATVTPRGLGVIYR